MKSYSPKELALAIGVSESSLKRWADEGRVVVTRTAGGHRRIDLAEAVRFIRQTHQKVIRPDVLGLASLPELEDPTESPATPAAMLKQALLRGDAHAARAQIVGRFLAAMPLPELFDHIIAPAMHEIGAMWLHSNEGIYLEHRATDGCLSAVMHLRSLLPPPAAQAPTAIGGAPQGDPYLLPSLMAATLLTEQGWNAVNLGAETPLDLLAETAQTHEAKLVWLSISSHQAAKGLSKQVEQLALRLDAIGASLALGGGACDALHVAPHANLFTGRDMSGLADFALGRLHALRAADSPPSTAAASPVT